MVFYVDVTFRQKGPDGRDLPRERCETSVNGPFTERSRAEHYAASVANTTAVFQAVIREGSNVVE